MRRLLATAAIAVLGIFGPGGGSADAVCATNVLCAVGGCTGTVNVCPTGASCTGTVNVCPLTPRNQCNGNIDVCGFGTICGIPCIVESR